LLNVLLIEMRDMRQAVQSYLASFVPNRARTGDRAVAPPSTDDPSNSVETTGQTLHRANASAVEEAGKFEVTREEVSGTSSHAQLLRGRASRLGRLHAAAWLDRARRQRVGSSPDAWLRHGAGRARLHRPRPRSRGWRGPARCVARRGLGNTSRDSRLGRSRWPRQRSRLGSSG